MCRKCLRSIQVAKCSCSAAEDLGPMELEYLLNLTKDSKKKRMLMSKRTMPQQESNGLSATATAAFLGDPPVNLGLHLLQPLANIPALMGLSNHKKQDCYKEDDEAETENNHSHCEPHHEVVDDLQPGVAQQSDGQGQNPIVALADYNITLDLNFHPEREQDLKVIPVQSSMPNLLHLANIPVESYMKQDGVCNLKSD